MQADQSRAPTPSHLLHLTHTPSQYHPCPKSPQGPSPNTWRPPDGTEPAEIIQRSRSTPSPLEITMKSGVHAFSHFCLLTPLRGPTWCDGLVLFRTLTIQSSFHDISFSVSSRSHLRRLKPPGTTKRDGAFHKSCH